MSVIGDGSGRDERDARRNTPNDGAPARRRPALTSRSTGFVGWHFGVIRSLARAGVLRFRIRVIYRRFVALRAIDADACIQRLCENYRRTQHIVRRSTVGGGSIDCTRRRSRNALGCVAFAERMAALMTGRTEQIGDRPALRTRLQMKRRAAVVTEFGARRIRVSAETA